MEKKILITGASELIGKELIKSLEKQNFRLILVGLDGIQLERLFSKHEIINYNDLDKYSENIDAVIHLEVLKNNAGATASRFQEVNVSLFKKVLDFCKKNNVPNVINLSSFHIYNDKKDPYSKSRQDAFHLSKRYNSPKISNIICPFIYSMPFNGKLSLLNKIPSPLKLPIFNLITALKPVVHIDTVICEIILKLDGRSDCQDSLLADAKDNNLPYLIFKKIVDLSFSISVLISFLVPMLLIWMSIILTSKGPGIFSQTRVGLKGKHFKLYKFRTMKVGTKNMGTHLATASDITRIGSMLRRTKLDEIPQIFNILLGHMTLVGPRPSLPEQLDLITFRIKKNVFDTMPGITGYAQVNQIDMSNPEALADWDSRYLKMRSIIFDILILKYTFLGKGGGDKIEKLNPLE